MAFDDDLQLVEEYVQWKAVRSMNDVTPGAFLIDRAKEAAYDKVEAALSYVLEHEDDLDVDQLLNILGG